MPSTLDPGEVECSSHRVYFLLGVQGQTIDKLASEVTSKQER